MTDVLVVLGGYLLGSMPFGYWLVRAVRGEDVRERGSGNIGATNVWRVYGRRYGIPVMLLDIAKGFVPALVGVLVSGDLLGVLPGGAAMAGHWRPLFLGFRKGGKTVATAGGVFWAVAPLVAAGRGADLVRPLPPLPLLVGGLDGRRRRTAARRLGARRAVAGDRLRGGRGGRRAPATPR